MGVKSLVEMCVKVAMENITKIESLANIPVYAQQEILAAIRSGPHLRSLEEDDPSLREISAPHWQRLIRKDFSLLAKQYNWVPQRPEEWHKVYRKYENLRKEQDAEATARLEAAFAATKKKADSRTAALVTSKDAWKLPRLPKDGRSSFAGFRGPSSSSGSGSGTRSGWGASASSAKPKDGKGFLQKARREARDINTRHINIISSSRAAAVTTKMRRAPESMVEAKRIERQFDPTASHAQAPAIRAPRPMAAREGQVERERKEREARLLSIKTGSKGQPGNVISFDDDADDDVFGDKSASSPPSSSENTHATPRKAGLIRRSGLLSASPGANLTSGTVRTLKRPAPDTTDAAPIAPRPLSTVGAGKTPVGSGTGAAKPGASTSSAAGQATPELMNRKAPTPSLLFVPKKKRRI